MTPNTQSTAPASQRRFVLLLMALATLFVIVPFLVWHETWFGRKLSNQEFEQYLGDEEHPRKIQHALSQIADRIVRGDPTAKQWYPKVAALARHPITEIRNTAAWVMGQDNSSEQFHQALLDLLDDPELMVRRNAALSLVRFADASGRPELVKMLQPYSVRAPRQGRVSIQLAARQQVGTRTLLARIIQENPQSSRGSWIVNRESKNQSRTTNHESRATSIEVRSPFAGQVLSILAQDGSLVTAGDQLVLIGPDSDQVGEALRGLYLVGQPEDQRAVERYARGVADMPDSIREQAIHTAKAIRTRSKRNPSR